MTSSLRFLIGSCIQVHIQHTDWLKIKNFCWHDVLHCMRIVCIFACITIANGSIGHNLLSCNFTSTDKKSFTQQWEFSHLKWSTFQFALLFLPSLSRKKAWTPFCNNFLVWWCHLGQIIRRDGNAKTKLSQVKEWSQIGGHRPLHIYSVILSQCRHCYSWVLSRTDRHRSLNRVPVSAELIRFLCGRLTLRKLTAIGLSRMRLFADFLCSCSISGSVWNRIGTMRTLGVLVLCVILLSGKWSQFF